MEARRDLYGSPHTALCIERTAVKMTCSRSHDDDGRPPGLRLLLLLLLLLLVVVGFRVAVADMEGPQ